jgi:hypothetical protein
MRDYRLDGAISCKAISCIREPQAGETCRAKLSLFESYATERGYVGSDWHGAIEPCIGGHVRGKAKVYATES